MLNEIAKVRQASRQMVQELGFLDNLFAEIGSYSQCHAIQELERNNLLNGTQISKLLNLEKSSVSRLIKELHKKQLCQITTDVSDSRTKLVALTKKGSMAVRHINDVADTQVSQALEQLTSEEREDVVKGLSLYAKALKKSRVKSLCVIKALKKCDIPKITTITKRVWEEFGFD